MVTFHEVTLYLLHKNFDETEETDAPWGIRYLLPAIEAAHRHGYHVITVDYLPDNIAHKYSDEYHNVSILDKDAVLKLARELQIDGILSYAVDPDVVTAAYVAEQILPLSTNLVGSRS